MRYLSVCSGIEAATVAWHPLGWTPAGFSEIEPFPRAVLEQRFGAVPVDFDHAWSPTSNVLPLFGDFTQIEERHVGPIDLLVGGTPCQSFSVAGKRLGLDDPRGNLAIEFLALARRLRPRWLVWENVPGVRSSWSGDAPGEAGDVAGWHEWTESCDFAAFLDLFRECGYRGGWRSLDAQFARVGGFERAVPQRRERVFAVGYLGDFARAATVLFERESLRGDPAPRRQSGKDVAGTLGASSSRSRGAGTDPAGLTGEQWNPDVSPALKARDFKGPSSDGDGDGAPLIAHALRADGFDASEDGTGRGTPLVACAITPDIAASLTRGAESGGKGGYAGRRQEDDSNLVAHPIAIQERAVSENPDNGPQGAGFREDGVSYTLEARHHVQAVAFDTTQITHPENRSNPQPGDPCHTLPKAGHAPAVAVSVSENSNGFAWEGDVAPTVQARAQSATGNQFDGVTDGWAVRRLTPRECERLQGFPDDHTLIEWRGKPAADGPRYKAIGNSMAVNVMRWLGERIQYVDDACAAAERERAA